MSVITDRFGQKLEIKDVLVGKNLNVWVIRGFASLDQLAFISAPDVYNQLTNPLGTQRDPDLGHAKKVLEYAINSVSEDPDTAPRAFPEIILNARDKSVVSLFRGIVESEIDFTSSSHDDDSSFPGKLMIHTQLIEPDRESNPQISRVDGNHRLLMVTRLAEEDSEETFPVVPFALFVGLTADQERALFRDINGEQKSMDTAHLDTIRLRLQSAGQLLQSESGLALWLAQKLSTSSYAFENLVFFGGDKKVFRQAGMTVPPVKINALKSTIATSLKESQEMDRHFNTDSNPNATEETLITNAKYRLTLLNRFWFAVRNAFPEAWQDRTNFILLQAIGLNAFARLGADVIDDLLEQKKPEQEDFDQILRHIASKVDLRREQWLGMAGLAGAKQVYRGLYDAKSLDFDRTQILEQLQEAVESPLDN